jgi:hypothetical protein
LVINAIYLRKNIEPIISTNLESVGAGLCK